MPLDELLITTSKSCLKVVFSQVSVCPQGVSISVPMPFRGVGISGFSQVPCPHREGVGMSRGMCTDPRWTWDLRGLCFGQKILTDL